MVPKAIAIAVGGIAAIAITIDGTTGRHGVNWMSISDAPKLAAALADPTAIAHLQKADPVLAQLIDARPDLRPRSWLQELPPLDAFGTLIFQVVGQRLSVSATRTILSRIEARLRIRGTGVSRVLLR